MTGELQTFSYSECDSSSIEVKTFATSLKKHQVNFKQNRHKTSLGHKGPFFFKGEICELWMLIDIMTVKFPSLLLFRWMMWPVAIGLLFSDFKYMKSFIQFWRKIFSVGKTDKQFQSGVFWWLINTWVGKFDYWINLNLTSLIILLRMFAGIQVEVSVVQ